MYQLSHPHKIKLFYLLLATMSNNAIGLCYESTTTFWNRKFVVKVLNSSAESTTTVCNREFVVKVLNRFRYRTDYGLHDSVKVFTWQFAGRVESDCRSRGHAFDPARSHTFVEIDYGHSPPSADSKRV